MEKAILWWYDSYSVGIQRFDDQHKKLFEIVNNVFTAIKSRKNPASLELLDGALNDLAEYVKLHFEAEEQAMRAHGYPEYDQHKKEHDDFTRLVADFKCRHDKGGAAITTELLGSLVAWLDTHLNGTDKRYTPYLAALNVK